MMISSEKVYIGKPREFRSISAGRCRKKFGNVGEEKKNLKCRRED